MTCQDFQQDLALAAAGCLDAHRLSEVREHCDACAACATRLEGFRRIASAHSTAAAELDGLSLRHPLRTSSDRPVVPSPDQVPTNLIWRWLLPVGVVAALVIGLVVRESAVNSISPRVDSERASVPAQSTSNPAPTLAVYRRAVGRSGDASLDALLARDADRLLRGAPRLEPHRLLDESF